jgi:hypothetical protein
MPTFEDLITAVFCSTFGGTITDATANSGLLAAYLVANGPQTVTVAATGRQYVVLAYGSPPQWKVRPGP